VFGPSGGKRSSETGLQSRGQAPLCFASSDQINNSRRTNSIRSTSSSSDHVGYLRSRAQGWAIG
jgi:hypothetical protein